MRVSPEYSSEAQRTRGLESKLVSIACFQLHIRSPRAHVPHSLTDTCQLQRVSLECGTDYLYISCTGHTSSVASLCCMCAGELRTFGVSTQHLRWSILRDMKIATGKVVGGKVVVEGVEFEEGTSVTVLARDDEGGVTLTPEEEAELLLAIAEADRGETVSAEEVLAKLAARHA